jgi:Protein of unknown function (DUF2975)
MNLLFIKILKWIVNVAWYILIPLMGLVSVIIIIRVWQMGYLIWDIPVYLKQPGNNLPALAATTTAAQFIGVNAAAAVLKIKLQLTPAIVTQVLLFFSASMVCLFGILYHLRKILNSLKANTPFAFENIRRLRLIGLFVFLLAVITFIDSVLNFMLLPTYFPAMNDIYLIRIDWGVKPILVSLVVFVLSEIFRQGYQLKTDNESFV